MASTKEKMQQARKLIQEKRYDEARAILRTIDHDKAYEWLDKIDAIQGKQKPTPITEKPKQQSSNSCLRSVLVSLVLLLVCPLAFTYLSSPSASNEPKSLQESVDLVASSLSILAGGRDVEAVRIVDTRDQGGERGIFVTYLSRENTEVGLADEWIDLFEAVGTSVAANNLDIDSVVLFVNDAFGNGVGIVTVDVSDIRAYQTGSMTRGVFLSRLSIETL